jgi:ABC-type taurine transport system ATPase subunit
LLQIWTVDEAVGLFEQVLVLAEQNGRWFLQEIRIGRFVRYLAGQIVDVVVVHIQLAARRGLLLEKILGRPANCAGA